MIKRIVAASTLALAGLGMSVSAAYADTQPANLGNVADADRGASATGPHCHFVLPASDNGPFDLIIAGTAHEAHTHTGLPTGIFQATPCP